jgi:chromosome segregation ATPase
MTDDLAEFTARTQALETDIATVRRERDSLRAELVDCRAQRDRLRLQQDTERNRLRVLQDAEQERLRRTLDVERTRTAARLAGLSAEALTNAQRAQAAERTVAELARELAAVRETLSWRVTRPLRAVRRRIRRG